MHQKEEYVLGNPLMEEMTDRKKKRELYSLYFTCNGASLFHVKILFFRYDNLY